MAVVIAFANQKGGVGKSTFSTQLAYFLRIKKHKKVLFIDMDAQGNATGTLLQILTDEDAELTSTNTQDLFEDELPESGLKIQTTKRGIDLIGTVSSPEAYDVEKLPLEKVMNPFKHLEHAFDSYDYVIIDCPPSLGNRLTSSLILADFVISPQKLSGYALDGIQNLLDTIVRIQEGPNPELKILGVVVNDWGDTADQKEMLKAITESLGDDVFKNRVRHRAPYDSASRGIPVWETRGGKRAADELIACFDEMLKKVKALAN